MLKAPEAPLYKRKQRNQTNPGYEHIHSAFLRVMHCQLWLCGVIHHFFIIGLINCWQQNESLCAHWDQWLMSWHQPASWLITKTWKTEFGIGTQTTLILKFQTLSCFHACVHGACCQAGAFKQVRVLHRMFCCCISCLRHSAVLSSQSGPSIALMTHRFCSSRQWEAVRVFGSKAANTQT